MLHYHLLCIGRRAKDPLLSAADTYEERLKHYAGITTQRLKEGSMAEEAQRLSAKIPANAWVIALDERGHAHSTQSLVAQIDGWQRQGVRHVALLIGGADGLHPSLKQAAKNTWALSKLTLPHRLAQVVLLEQLYRAHTILRGEKYHRV